VPEASAGVAERVTSGTPETHEAPASARVARPQPRQTVGPLLLDTTMFWSPTGGGVRRYLLTKRAWIQSGGAGVGGWRHAIAAPGLDAELGIDLGGLPIPGSGGYRAVWARRAAARAMAALQPDVIEVGDPYRLAWSALDAAQALGVPAVACCHSDLPALAARLAGRHALSRRGLRAAAERYLRHVYREFDLVLAPGRAVVEMLRGLGLDHAQQQAMGVDAAVFRPQPAEPHLRERLGLPAGVKLLLYAGRFAPEKNLPLLVDALARLGPGYALLAVGDGAARPPLHDRLRILPFEPQADALARLMCSVDVFVHAGDQETFGIAALEAMACALPVVVRQCAGLAEVAEHGGGLAVDSTEPAVWAEAIAAVCDAPREHWGAPARRRALQYRWDRLLPQLFGRYERLLISARSRDGALQREPASLRPSC